MKYFLVSLLFLNLVSAVELDDRRSKIIQIIDRELSEVSRLSQNVNRNDPNLLLRIAELNLEKARLWKEKENEEFLNIDSAQRSKVNKKEFFKISTGYFDRAKIVCLELIKKFNRFKEIADAYYILAYHYKEFDDAKNATKYFDLATKRSSGKSVTKTRSQVALAELFYNKGDYKRAIPLYEESLRDNVDKWWTKDAFNLAWSYLRTHKANNGLTWMKQIHAKSKDGQFVDMSNYVIRDIALFFAEANRIDEAFEYYKEHNADFSEQILKLSEKLNNTQAEKVLRIAIKHEKRPEMKINLMMALSETYNKFARYSELKILMESLTSKDNYELLNSDQKERVLYLTEKNAAEIQKKVVSDLYVKVPKTRLKYAKLATDYFSMLIRIHDKKAEEFEYYKAETYFAVSDMDMALDGYLKTYDMSVSKNNQKFQKLAMEGALVCLGSPRLSTKDKNANYLNVYNRYLAMDNKSKRAKEIYQRVFKVHYENKNISESEKTLVEFKQNFPSDLGIQEAMIAQIMEYYRNKNDDTQVKAWIAKIESGEYKVSSKYKSRLKILLTNMQMKDVEQARNNGDKASALEQYLKIYADPNSTNSTKKNSAYNISVLFYELGNIEKLNEWSHKSVDSMGSEELIKFSSSFITFTSYFFEKMEFEKSADLSEKILEKTCLSNFKQKEQLFVNAVYLRLALKNDGKVGQMLAKYNKCALSENTLNEIRLELADVYLENNKFESLEKIVLILGKDSKNSSKILTYLMALESKYEKLSDNSNAKKYSQLFNKHYTDAKKQNQSIPMDVRNYVSAEKYKLLVRNITSLGQIKIEFPEAQLNESLKKKLKLLEMVTTEATNIINEGSDSYMVKCYEQLVTQYQNVSRELLSIAIPADKSEEYKKSFNKAMRDVAVPIANKANDFQKTAMNEINKYKLLSKENYFFTSDRRFEYRYVSPAAVYMEREGSKW